MGRDFQDLKCTEASPLPLFNLNLVNLVNLENIASLDKYDFQVILKSSSRGLDQPNSEKFEPLCYIS
jgi:hypothetical protein